MQATYQLICQCIYTDHPGIPTEFDVVEENTTETSVSVTWKSAFAGGLDQTFVVEYRSAEGADADGNGWIVAVSVPGGQLENTQFTAEVTDLDLCMEYDLRVLSKNDVGDSSYTPSVMAKTDCGDCACMYLLRIMRSYLSVFVLHRVG
jgi:hypothetical protein